MSMRTHRLAPVNSAHTLAVCAASAVALCMASMHLATTRPAYPAPAPPSVVVASSPQPALAPDRGDVVWHGR